MLNCSSAVSGFASNRPSAPTKTVLGWAVIVGRSCAKRNVQARSTGISKGVEVFMMSLLIGPREFIRLGGPTTKNVAKRQTWRINRTEKERRGFGKPAPLSPSESALRRQRRSSRFEPQKIKPKKISPKKSTRGEKLNARILAGDDRAAPRGRCSYRGEDCGRSGFLQVRPPSRRHRHQSRLLCPTRCSTASRAEPRAHDCGFNRAPLAH